MNLYQYVGPENARRFSERQAEGLFERIEPCKHGNYVRHLLTILENSKRVWCQGTRFKEADSASKAERHMCGLNGFNPMLGDDCPACSRYRNQREEKV